MNMLVCIYVGRRRSELRRDTLQQNPAYEACTPKPCPPPDQQGAAYCTASPQRGRELSHSNTYTAAAADVSCTQEKVYEEIA